MGSDKQMIVVEFKDICHGSWLRTFKRLLKLRYKCYYLDLKQCFELIILSMSFQFVYEAVYQDRVCISWHFVS